MNSSETCDCITVDSGSLQKDSNDKIENGNENIANLYRIVKIGASNSTDVTNNSSNALSNYRQYNVSMKEIKNDYSKPCSCSSNVESSLKPCTCISEESSLKTCVCSSSCDSLDTDTTIDRPQDLPVECTLAIIKPEGMMYRNEIEREIIDEGFKICQRRWLQLTPEQVSDFYFDNYKRRNFAHLITYMSSEPILVFVLAKCNAIKEWKSLIGPKKVTNARIYAPDSIRGKYGRKGDDMKNTVHGSDSPQAAEREIHFFFPDRIEEPLLDEEDTVEYLKKYVNGPLSNALVKCCEERPNDPVTWLGNWLLEHNTMKPKYLLRYKSNLYD